MDAAFRWLLLILGLQICRMAPSPQDGVCSPCGFTGGSVLGQSSSLLPARRKSCAEGIRMYPVLVKMDVLWYCLGMPMDAHSTTSEACPCRVYRKPFCHNTQD